MKPPGWIPWILILLAVAGAEVGLVLAHHQLGWLLTLIWAAWPLFALLWCRAWIISHRIVKDYERICASYRQSCDTYRRTTDTLMRLVAAATHEDAP